MSPGVSRSLALGSGGDECGDVVTNMEFADFEDVGAETPPVDERAENGARGIAIDDGAGFAEAHAAATEGPDHLFPIVAQEVSDPHWQRHLQQIGPMTAGLAIQATTNLRSLPIGPWAGLGVLAAWAAAALLAGGLLLRWRDA